MHISRGCTPPYLSTRISNLLQPAQAEVVLGQPSTYLASWVKTKRGPGPLECGNARLARTLMRYSPIVREMFTGVKYCVRQSMGWGLASFLLPPPPHTLPYTLLYILYILQFAKVVRKLLVNITSASTASLCCIGRGPRSCRGHLDRQRR